MKKVTFEEDDYPLDIKSSVTPNKTSDNSKQRDKEEAQIIRNNEGTK